LLRLSWVGVVFLSPRLKYGKPEVMKSSVSMTIFNEIATVSHITVWYFHNLSVSWQKGSTHQLYSLVAKTGNNMAIAQAKQLIET
jgi:hypothetical protein